MYSFFFFMKRLIWVLFSFSLMAYGLHTYYQGSLNFQMDQNSGVFASLTVSEGQSAEAVARSLKKEGLIRSELAFRYFVRANDYDASIKAGRYAIETTTPLPQIVELLTSGESGQTVVTLLEGWTTWEVAEYLERQGLTTQDTFMACLEICEFEFDFLPGDSLEGYLYPDTYFVDPATFSDEAFIDRLLFTFESKLSEEDLTAIEASDRSLNEIIIMASIVEREERNNAEKSTVAGILWNRLDDGMMLGADATVLYALDRTSGGLSASDLQTDSPYNTRRLRGLPPTAISNPSIESIQAALYPAQTDYYYYLHDAEGRIHYGRTLEEHNVNKAAYL